MNGNYEKLVSIISKSSGLEKSEIEDKINVKRERISGLISKEGAAQIVAAELGISFDNEKLKIDELLPGMKKVNVVGKVIQIFPVRTFVRNGQESKVTNLIIADETGNIRAVLWDTHHISLIENSEITHESVVEIGNATMRENELHLGSFSELRKSKEQIAEVKTEKKVFKKDISDFKISDNASTRAFIVQAFEPRAFKICPECRKKIIIEADSFRCETHGNVAPEERYLMNLVLDDGTETIRAVVFHDILKNFGISLENPELLSQEKEKLLGKEMLFSGEVRMNKFFNNSEFIINEVREVNVDELLVNLEKR